MQGQDLIKEIAKGVPIASNEYSGNLDNNGLRTGTGDEQWRCELYERYKGRFLQDSLHGRGKYSWTRGDEQTVYEGLFYASDLNGYGKFSYNDTSVFEGLFKSNSRFGPGVFTYADGNQDVGMWMGKNLMRLCCVIKPEWVPRLARTPMAKVKLLKFKKLVSVCNIPRDRAKDVLEKLEVTGDVMQQSDKLYNIHIRNPKSHFFNTTLYNKNYFCEEDCYIEVALSPEEEKTYCEEVSGEKTELEEEHTTSNPLTVITTNECVCDDPKQIRLEEIKSELDHTEQVLTRIRNEIKKAKCKKKLAKRRTAENEDIRKSVAWENIEGIVESNTTLVSSSYKRPVKQDVESEGDDELLEEECEPEEEGEVDYDTACKLLAAAQSAEKLLLLKKANLTNKLVYETESLEKKENETDQRPTKKVLITELLAWNNQETSTEMMKHVFLHRNFEKDMPYCVIDLLTGDRSEFRNPGTYEEDCVSFLKLCSNGNTKEASNLLQKNDLNPDLCDAKGNTGMIYAAARDKTKMIRTLVNFGSNVDILNDECFTPLGMCITRYLAVQHDVIDWENAFLKPTSIENEEEQEVREWRPHVSLTSMSQIILQLNTEKSIENFASTRRSRQLSPAKLEGISEIFGSDFDVIHSNLIGSVTDLEHRLCRLRASNDFQERYIQNVVNETSQPYILNTECVKPPPEKKKKEKKEKKEKKGKKDKSSSKKSDKSSKKSDKSSKKSGKKSSEKSTPKEPSKESLEKIEMKPEEVLRNNKLSAIYDTIAFLLKYGANPNVCEVPMPTLILAVFTKNLLLIEDLLASNADPNITTMDEKLTALHVLVSLPPCEELLEILKFLLKHSADPNCRAGINHWVEEKKELLGQHVLEEEDEGKTPLHLLSMRYDFVWDTNDYMNQLVPIIMEHGGKVKARYLGHTPLSLAIMRKNLKLIRTLLDTKRINPNQQLGENMGVPLTLFVLKRYKDVLPDIDACQAIIQLLLEYKANPFDTIEGIGNAIEFMIKEHEEPPKPEMKGKKENGKKKGKNKSTGSKKSAKKDQKGKKGKKGAGLIQEEVKKFLMTVAKTVLEKHIKGYAVKYLYLFVEEEDYYDDISANMARFLTPEETIKIAQLLVYRGEILIDTATNYDVLYDLVEFVINVSTKRKDPDVAPSSLVDIHKMLENFEFKKIPNEQGKLNLPEPEAERHSEKYNVCFQCYRKKQCPLFICPECRLIYFCSQECNKLNNKEKNPLHKCGTLFYNEQREIHEERIAKASHWRRASEARKQLSELAVEKGWVLGPIDENIFDHKRHIKPDPTRRLHLSRSLRHPAPDKRESLADSILSLRWRKEGSEFLSWMKGVKDEKAVGKKVKYRGEISQEKKYRKNAKGKGYSSDEEVEGQKERKGRSESEKKGTGKSKAFRGEGRSLSESEGDKGIEPFEKSGSGAAKGKGRGGAAKDKGVDDTAKVEGHGRAAKEGSGVGARKGEGRGGASEDEDHYGTIKGEGRGKTIKGEDRDGTTKTKDQYGAIKGEGRSGATKGEGRGGPTKDESRGGATKSEGRSGATKGEGRGGATKSEGRSGATKGEGRGGATKGTGRDEVTKNGRAAKGEREDNAAAKEREKEVSGKVGQQRAKMGIAGLDKSGLTGTETLDFETCGGQPAGYIMMPTGGKILELKRRLPSKYQYFLEKISEYWPDFDMSMVFLPYACYSHGQLYYRFLSNKPVFMETYSHN